MAVRRNKKETKDQKEFKEFTVLGKNYEYSGRLYPAKEGNRHFVYLSFNKYVTIQCYFICTEDNCFIAGPQWKAKDGSWKNYTYFDKKLDDDLDKVCEELEKLLED